MLAIKINNTYITPMRPDAPNMFSSPDVPHGTDSCIVKALKVAASNGIQVPTPPAFTKEELAAHKAAFLATVTVLPLFDGEGNKIDRMFSAQKQNEILEIDDETVKKEFYSNYPLPTVPSFDAEGKPVVAELKPRMKASGMMPMMGKEEQMYADLAACKLALTAKAKEECAQRLLDHAVNECLIVPELSDEFKAQFELIEVAVV